MSATLNELRAAWERDRDECGECYIRRPHETSWHLCAYHDGYEDALDRLAALEAPKGTPLEWVADPAGGYSAHSNRIMWTLNPRAGGAFALALAKAGVRVTLMNCPDEPAGKALAQRLADVLGSES